MAKRRTYFEQVPVAIVRRVAELDASDAEQKDSRDMKENGRSERLVSGKEAVPPSEPKCCDSRV